MAVEQTVGNVAAALSTAQGLTQSTMQMESWDWFVKKGI